MSQMGGATEHVIARARIPVEMDLAPLEEGKREVERIAGEMANTIKERVGGAFREVFADANAALEDLKRNMAAVPTPSAPSASGANPNTGTVADPTLAKLTDIQGSITRLEATADGIKEALERPKES